MITKEDILKTATKLFLKNGVRTVTIDRIVKELRTSKRTLYRDFKNKDELLKACLSAYHNKIRQENEVLIKQGGNVIEALGYLYNSILKREQQINPNFYNDLLHYYPKILKESYRSNGNFAHAQILLLAEWGIKDGIFIKDMEKEVAMKTLLVLINMLMDTNRFPSEDFSKERLTFGIILPYLRGFCTPKGLEIVQKLEAHFRVVI